MKVVRICLAGLVTILLGSGCSGKAKDEGPETWKAVGKVVYADGSPVRRGRIDFDSPDGSRRAGGDIGEEGDFTLHTFTVRGQKTGAEAGEYRVTVTPFQTGQQEKDLPKTLPRPSTIQANHDNELKIVVPR